MKNYGLLTLLLIVIISFASCSDEDLPDVDCSSDLSTLFGFKLLEINNEIAVYNLDPNEANCITVRDSINSFLKEARPYNNCTENTPELIELKTAIQVLEENLDLLSC